MKKGLLALVALGVVGAASVFPFIRTPHIFMGDWDLLVDANLWALRQNLTERLTFLDGNAFFPAGTVTHNAALYRISPTQISATTHNYAPTNCATFSLWDLTSDASRSITGIDSTTCAGGSAVNRVIVLCNVGAQNIVLEDDDAGSNAENRFALQADETLSPDECITLVYDAANLRFRPI